MVCLHREWEKAKVYNGNSEILKALRVLKRYLVKSLTSSSTMYGFFACTGQQCTSKGKVDNDCKHEFKQCSFQKLKKSAFKCFLRKEIYFVC